MRRESRVATTYYAETAELQLAQAQRTLDTHVTSILDGRCRACGVPGPCWRWENAVMIFARTLRLPVRTPGATVQDLCGGADPPVAWFGHCVPTSDAGLLC